MSDPNYIPENEREPFQHSSLIIPPYGDIKYFPFPNMNVSEINIYNSQGHEIEFELSYNNGNLRITILEKL